MGFSQSEVGDTAHVRLFFSFFFAIFANFYYSTSKLHILFGSGQRNAGLLDLYPISERDCENLQIKLLAIVPHAERFECLKMEIDAQVNEIISIKQI
jgi:hypothetical protein